jgi:hypothetical protein
MTTVKVYYWDTDEQEVFEFDVTLPEPEGPGTGSRQFAGSLRVRLPSWLRMGLAEDPPKSKRCRIAGGFTDADGVIVLDGGPSREGDRGPETHLYVCVQLPVRAKTLAAKELADWDQKTNG